ncbi:hypothetical protein M758_UG044000 [Ceratodon purpureus]|nr:hypothetical protein M758_UG043500 [Ceratodon purpureus]KAG0594056.1 hypothetical protein M758_UG044000 [Ceratodon purpureus]
MWSPLYCNQLYSLPACPEFKVQLQASFNAYVDLDLDLGLGLFQNRHTHTSDYHRDLVTPSLQSMFTMLTQISAFLCSHPQCSLSSWKLKIFITLILNLFIISFSYEFYVYFVNVLLSFFHWQYLYLVMIMPIFVNVIFDNQM